MAFTGLAPYLLNEKADYILFQEAVDFNVCGEDQKASILIADFLYPLDPSGSLDGVAESSEHP